MGVLLRESMRVAMMVLCLMSGVTIGLASTTVFQVPEGWLGDPYGASPAASTSSFAVAVYQYRVNEPRIVENSRIVQVLGSSEYATDFQLRKVLSLQYSPDGNYLLARSISTSESEIKLDRQKTSLLNSQGQILWEKDDRRQFQFSVTGEVISAWRNRGLGEGGSSVEIFDLEGNSLGNFTMEAPIRGLIVPGSGDEIIVAIGGSVTRLDITQSPTTLWNVDIPPDYPHMLFLRSIDSTRFLVQLEEGASVILGLDGTQYVYDPVTLGNTDPSFSPVGYASYQPYQGPNDESVTLYDGSTVVRDLNLVTGVVTPRDLGLEVPGFSPAPSLVNQKAFLLSRSEIRVVSLAAGP